MIAIIDYGVGNLFSLTSSFRAIGADVIVTGDAEKIRAADKIILPGVGAFADAAKKLFDSGLADVVKEEVEGGKPIMGICLGMQLLFEKSYEYGCHEGLGLLHGSIVPIADVVTSDYKIPQIGWNSLMIKKETPILKYIKEGDFVYFVHSFYADDCEESVAATTEYGAELTAAVTYKNIYGCQFHPEKSGDVGLSILRAFSEIEV